jgi:hypothetical protein
MRKFKDIKSSGTRKGLLNDNHKKLILDTASESIEEVLSQFKIRFNMDLNRDALYKARCSLKNGIGLPKALTLKDLELEQEIEKFIIQNYGSSGSQLSQLIREVYQIDISAQEIYSIKNRKDNKEQVQTIDKKPAISAEIEIKNTGNEILKQNGFDPTKYGISHFWLSDPDSNISMFVKNKSVEDTVTKEDIDGFFKNYTPISLPLTKSFSVGGSDYLINLADIHFGITDFSHAKKTLDNIRGYFSSQPKANKICINLLGDEFHTAITGQSTTTSFTQLNKTYGRKGMIDAYTFFCGSILRHFTSL